MTTPGINTMQELVESEGIEVDCLGGGLRSVRQSFVGPLAEAALEQKSFDRMFLGADAVTAEDGICEAEHGQTRLKELMARRGRDVYVLVDSCKLCLRPLPRLGTLGFAMDIGDGRRRWPLARAEVPGCGGTG